MVLEQLGRTQQHSRMGIVAAHMAGIALGAEGRSLISSMGRASKSARSMMQGLPLPMVATTPVDAFISGNPILMYFCRTLSSITPQRWDAMPISASRFSI